jgi:hypothetical protein
MSTEFRTNRRTRAVFPLDTASFKTEYMGPQSASGRREFQRFKDVKAKQDRSQWREIAGYPNHDTYETSLILENDQRSYRWLREWGKAWAKKMKSGRFDREAAEYAVYKYIVPAAQGKGRAREWKAGIFYDENMRPYREDEFVGDEDIDRKNVDYGYIVDRINEDWAEKVAWETANPGTKG